MYFQRQRCGICGTNEGIVFHTDFIRLGPSMHECRSCWTVTGTGRREWAQLDAAERRGFLLQPLYVAILVLLLAVAAAICGLLVASDRAALLLLVAKVGGAAFLVVFALMELRALLHVAALVRRTKRAASNR